VAGNGGYYYVESPDSINDIIARGVLVRCSQPSPRLAAQHPTRRGCEAGRKVVGFEVQEKDGAQSVDVPTLRSNDRKF